jgi:ABC-type transport system involved in cytochrome c biogenesis permease component
MTCWPVIVRELRTEARRPFNFWLRVLGAGAIAAVFAVSMLDQSDAPAGLGARLFGNLNATLFLAVWTFVPLLTADCISKEKRDGTIGLLFLTRLKAGGIVVGKSLIHALRSMTILLGMIPVLSVPFLLGGVSWKDGILALLLNTGAVGLALAASLLASTLVKDWSRALLLALLLSFAIGALFMRGHYLGCLWLETHLAAKNRWGPVSFAQLLDWFRHEDVLTQFSQAFSATTNLPGGQPPYGFYPPGPIV